MISYNICWYEKHDDIEFTTKRCLTKSRAIFELEKLTSYPDRFDYIKYYIKEEELEFVEEADYKANNYANNKRV